MIFFLIIKRIESNYYVNLGVKWKKRSFWVIYLLDPFPSRFISIQIQKPFSQVGNFGSSIRRFRVDSFLLISSMALELELEKSSFLNRSIQVVRKRETIPLFGLEQESQMQLKWKRKVVRFLQMLFSCFSCLSSFDLLRYFFVDGFLIFS